MTDSPEEKVIAEAMAIIDAEVTKVDAESCPKGEDCSVHHRVNESTIDEPDMYARLITYVGDYVVITEDNPEMRSVSVLVGALLGLQVKPPFRWETVIFHVGGGTIHDVAQLDREGQEAALRYAHKHDSWEGVKDVHEGTLIMLESGLIDVSKKWEG